MRIAEAIKILKSLATFAAGDGSRYIYSDEDTKDAVSIAITALELLEERTKDDRNI